MAIVSPSDFVKKCCFFQMKVVYLQMNVFESIGRHLNHHGIICHETAAGIFLHPDLPEGPHREAELDEPPRGVETTATAYSHTGKPIMERHMHTAQGKPSVTV